MIRSLLPAPEKNTYLFPANAVYGEDDKPVCGECYSKLAPDWGKNRGGTSNAVEYLTSVQGDDYTEDSGESWIVWEEYYKCYNPACDVRSLVRYLPAKLGFANPYHPKDVAKHRIPKKFVKAYRYTENGVFETKGSNGRYAPVNVDAGDRGVEVSFEDPWVYINPGEFEENIPPTWTRRDDGWIKSNASSKRYEEIYKWFSARKIDLNDYKESD